MTCFPECPHTVCIKCLAVRPFVVPDPGQLLMEINVEIERRIAERRAGRSGQGRRKAADRFLLHKMSCHEGPTKEDV